jgi:hypothetical protein
LEDVVNLHRTPDLASVFLGHDAHDAHDDFFGAVGSVHFLRLSTSSIAVLFSDCTPRLYHF